MILKNFGVNNSTLVLAWVQYPEGAGGLGINPKYQLLVTEISKRMKEYLNRIELQTFLELEWHLLQLLSTELRRTDF